MESLFFSLTEILQALNDNMTAVRKATENHNQALRNNDMEGIKGALKELDVLAVQTKYLDSKREDIQGQLEAKLGLAKGASLSDTLTQAPAQYAEALKSAATTLRGTTAAIQEIVQLNKILTQQAMQFNDVLLKVIRPAKATYNPNGQADTTSKATSLLNRTV